MCDPQIGAELVCFSGIFISLLSANRKINETADRESSWFQVWMLKTSSEAFIMMILVSMAPQSGTCLYHYDNTMKSSDLAQQPNNKDNNHHKS